MQSEKIFAVYLLASRPRGATYLGVTGNLPQRVAQHKNRLLRGYTSRFNIDRLVWFELYGAPEPAITREKQLKKWRRAWKWALIEEDNPGWRDLSGELA